MKKLRQMDKTHVNTLEMIVLAVVCLGCQQLPVGDTWQTSILMTCMGTAYGLMEFVFNAKNPLKAASPYFVGGIGGWLLAKITPAKYVIFVLIAIVACCAVWEIYRRRLRKAK